MGICRRAWLYLIRNKGKTGILLALLVVISTLVLLCVSIGNAANASLASLRERLGGYFSVKMNREQGYYEFVKDEMVQDILGNGGIKAYNGMDIQYLMVQDMELLPGRFTSEGDEKARLTRALGNTDSSLNEYFVLEYYKLAKGRHITPEDQGAALISEDLAERNGLSVGDTVSMKIQDEMFPDEQKQKVTAHTAKIVGIFSIETALSTESVNSPECDIEKNFIFTDTSYIRNLYDELGGRMGYYTDGAAFFVKDPKELDAIIESLNGIDGYEWEGFSVTKNNKTYEDSAMPLERLSGIVVMMVFVIVVISAVMLSLVLFLWMRDRVHEIGVYLSIGKTRAEILGQHILENLLVAAISFCIAFGICMAASGAVDSAVGAAFFEEADGDAEIPRLVEIGAFELFEVAGIGGAIILLSTGVSSVLGLRMRPKEVLSLMS